MTFKPARDELEMEDAATVRYLQSTYPFDSEKAVLFVSERTQKSLKTVHVEDTADKNNHDECSLTGDEAKEFYEEVLSLPRQNTREPDVRRIAPHSRDSGCSISVVGFRGKVPKSKNTSKKAKSAKSNFTSFQLFQYAQNNQLDLLQSALLDERFNVDIQDNFHWTLLMVAAYAGHMTIVQYLLDRGASVRWRKYTDRGMNAADLARVRSHEDIAELIENYDSCDNLKGESIHSTSELDTHSEDTKFSVKKKSHGLYCDSCQTATNSVTASCHDASIIHLYSGQRHGSSTTSYGIPGSNRGFQMLLRSGWDPEGGLGPQRQGKKFPVKTVLKQDRLGLGLVSGRARVTHFSAHDKEAVRSHRDRYRKKEQPSKKKKDIIKEKHKERQWERRIRTIMNHEDSYSDLFT